MLASSALGMDASALVAYGENLVDPHASDRLRAMVRRRKTGEPVAYIVGHKDFYGLRFAVDARVLVPRPETEELVGLVIEDWQGRFASILDLGTGCGAIACALAHALPDARVTATDVDPRALEVARENAHALGLTDRIAFAAGDLFAPFADAGNRFDAIAANLPYVAESDGALDPAVHRFEPPGALMAGVDGLDAYRRMLAHAGHHVSSRGALYLECGPANATALAAIVRSSLPGSSVEVLTDLAHLDRFVVARLEASA